MGEVQRRRREGRKERGRGRKCSLGVEDDLMALNHDMEGVEMREGLQEQQGPGRCPGGGIELSRPSRIRAKTSSE